MKPLVSIIIPVYNADKFLRRLLDSVYALEVDVGTYEVIVVDDCSCDNSLEILEDYSNRYENFQILHHDVNMGVACARNSGLELSRGQYVWYVDADDEINAPLGSQLFSMLRDGNLDMLVFNHIKVKDGLHVQDNYYLLGDSRQVTGPELFCQSRVHPAPWNKIVRRDFLINNNIKFDTDIFPEDEKWGQMCFLYAQRARSSACVGYYQHVVQNSLSRSRSIIPKYISGFPRVIESHIGLMRKYELPAFWMKVLSSLVKGWDNYLCQGVEHALISTREYRENLRRAQQMLRVALPKLSVQCNRDCIMLILLCVSPWLFEAGKKMTTYLKRNKT